MIARCLRRCRGAWALPVVIAVWGTTLSGADRVSDLEDRLQGTEGIERLEILEELAYSMAYRSTEASVRYGEEQLVLAQSLGDRLGEGKALHNLAVAYSVAGDHMTSMDHASRARDRFAEAGESRLEAVALNTMGVCQRMLDHYDEALGFYDQSLAIAREIGDRRGEALALNNVANVHYDRGDFERALELHRQVLGIKRELGEEGDPAGSLNNIGIALYRLGRYDEALENLLEALELEETAGNLSAAGGSATNIGNIFEKMGQLDQARAYFERAAAMQTEVGNLSGLLSATMNLGNVCQRLERYDEAVDHYTEALDLSRRTDSPRGEAAALDNLGTVHRRREQFAQALSLHRRALAIREQLGLQHEMATSCQNIGMALVGLGRLAEARPQLLRALGLAEDVGSIAQEEELLVDLAELEERAGDLAAALEYRKRAAGARDELLNERTNARIAELEARHQAADREKEIALLAKDREIYRLDASRARLRANLVLMVLVVGLAGVGLLIHRYRSLLLFWRRHSRISHYRLVEQIAAGGMGVVHRAEDVLRPSETYALKVISDRHAADASVRRRFLHEAAVVDQLAHPHIVKVHERGEDDGRLFMAMELLEGPSLAEVIRRDGPLPVADSAWIMIQLAEVVASLHAKGVVHRDLKPDNIVLVESDGDPLFVKLLDFGLARTEGLTRMTETGMFVGTIAYLAPEVITEQQATPASDVWALGVVFYELLAGKPPFPGATPAEVIRRILDCEPEALRTLRPELETDLETLVGGMMARDPGMRPSAGSVAVRLSQSYGREPASHEPEPSPAE